MAIKKLQNDFTTPDQSNRLLELGVPADSANMKWRRIKKNSHGDKPLVKCEWNVALKHQTELVCGFMEYEYIPCWSVGRLIEIYNMCVDFDLDDGAAIVIFIQDESPIVQMMQMFEDKVGIMNFSKLEE